MFIVSNDTKFYHNTLLDYVDNNWKLFNIGVTLITFDISSGTAQIHMWMRIEVVVEVVGAVRDVVLVSEEDAGLTNGMLPPSLVSISYIDCVFSVKPLIIGDYLLNLPNLVATK